MSATEGLVDLSLFTRSPTDDRHLAASSCSNILPPPSDIPANAFAEPARTTPEFDAPRSDQDRRRAEYLSKPLPPLPPTTICRGVSVPSNFPSQLTRIWSHMKRKRTDESPTSNGENLLRRRNVASSPPQLTLSVPPPASNNRSAVSEMIWMSEEQMWLVLPHARQDRRLRSTECPTPPVYSSPRSYTRSEPTPSVRSPANVTPPMSPVQSQLQSLMIQPRDEERLSPLFQEAMNSVPMEDTFDPPPPPTYEGTVQGKPLPSSPSYRAELTWPSLATPANKPLRAGNTGSSSATAPTAYSETTSSLSRFQTDHNSRSRLKPATSKYGIWAPSFGSRSQPGAHGRWQTSGGPEGHNGALGFLHQEIAASSRSWHGLARKISPSRPRSAT